MGTNGTLVTESTLSTSPALSKELAHMGEHFVSPAGTFLFHQACDSIGVFLIHSGRLVLFLENPNGEAISERLIGPNSLLGLPAAFTSRPYSLSAKTLETCSFTLIPTGVVRSFVETSPLGPEILQILSREVSELQQILRKQTV